MNKKLQANVSYSLVHASMWGMYAVIIYFAKTFLSAQDLSDAQCSLVLGITAAAAQKRYERAIDILREKEVSNGTETV